MRFRKLHVAECSRESIACPHVDAYLRRLLEIEHHPTAEDAQKRRTTNALNDYAENEVGCEREVEDIEHSYADSTVRTQKVQNARNEIRE